MKNIVKIVLVSTFMMLGSCSEFLNEDLKGTYSTESFYQTEEHAFLALTGIYNIVSFASTNNALWVFGDVASDDALKGGSAGDQNDIQSLDDFTYSRNNGFIEKIWKYYYEGITRANYLLLFGSSIQMDPDEKAKILGEAKFLRAYFYFNLVNIFGEVPLKTQPPLNSELINIGKSDVSDIYAQIEADLQDAILVLPESHSGFEGRATLGSAYGLLAKAALYQEKWQESLDAIEALDIIGQYNLDPMYTAAFSSATQNGIYSIFEVQHLSGQIPKLGSHLNQWFGSPDDNGYFFNVPLQNFVNEFEISSGGVTDPRLDYTVGQSGQNWINGEPFDPTWSPTGYLQKKHLQPLAEEPVIGDAGLNYVYLRYADILLMKAEALNELSRGAESILPLNTVRRRARESYLNDTELPGFGTVPVGLLPDVLDVGQSGLRTAIRHERRVELGFEFHRFFDLMRYGQTVAEAALSDTNFSYSEHRYFPIPQSEVDTNTKIEN